MIEHVQAYFIGCDIGRAQDNSALAVLARRIEMVDPRVFDPSSALPMYYCTYLRRYDLQTPYFMVQEDAARIWALPDLRATSNYMIWDATGVGMPLVEAMRRQHRIPVKGVTITGGDNSSNPKPNDYNVAKSHLVTSLMDLVQRKRLKVLQGVMHGEEFLRQLDVFGYKVNKDTGNMSYEATIEKVHDDLVIAMALAVWFAERVTPFFMPKVGGNDNPPYDPLGRKA